MLTEYTLTHVMYVCVCVSVGVDASKPILQTGIVQFVLQFRHNYCHLTNGDNFYSIFDFLIVRVCVCLWLTLIWNSIYEFYEFHLIFTASDFPFVYLCQVNLFDHFAIQVEFCAKATKIGKLSHLSVVVVIFLRLSVALSVFCSCSYFSTVNSLLAPNGMPTCHLLLYLLLMLLDVFQQHFQTNKQTTEYKRFSSFSIFRFSISYQPDSNRQKLLSWNVDEAHEKKWNETKRSTQRKLASKSEKDKTE